LDVVALPLDAVLLPGEPSSREGFMNAILRCLDWRLLTQMTPKDRWGEHMGPLSGGPAQEASGEGAIWDLE
jgi:hypothetical protein